MTYFDWDGSYNGAGVSCRRLMFFGGLRITFHPGGRSKIAPCVEGGLELDYGRSEVYISSFGT